MTASRLPAGSPGQQLRRATGAATQPRYDAIADTLDRMTPDWDEIVRHAHATRLGTRFRTHADSERLDELLANFERDIAQLRRGRRAVHPPRYVSTDGRHAGW